MEAEDEARNLTVTVELELDDDIIIPNKDNHIDEENCTSTTSKDLTSSEIVDDKNENSSFLKIGPRTLPSEVCPQLSDASLKIQDLNAEAMRLLELRLNPYAVGTLKNWEFVCAQLGLSIEEIMDIRNTPNPTAKMLHTFRNVSLKRFLEILCIMNRVDVLISIVKFIENLKPRLNPLVGNKRFSQMETTTLISELQKSCRLNDDINYILLLHHESSKETRQYFKYLSKNLQNQCNEANKNVGKRTTLIDVNDCIDELNLYDTGQRLFDRARTIVVVFSANYVNEVCNVEQSRSFKNTKNSILRFKIFLHHLTNAEYISNQLVNRRFRAVQITRDIDRAPLPKGWPTNTLVYHFPENYEQLCKKLFYADYNKAKSSVVANNIMPMSSSTSVSTIVTNNGENESEKTS